MPVSDYNILLHSGWEMSLLSNNNKLLYLWSSFPSGVCSGPEVLLLWKTHQQTSPEPPSWASNHSFTTESPHNVSYSSGISVLKPWWPSPVSSFQLFSFPGLSSQRTQVRQEELRATVFPALLAVPALLCDMAAEAGRWRTILKMFIIDSVNTFL